MNLFYFHREKIYFTYVLGKKLRELICWSSVMASSTKLLILIEQYVKRGLSLIYLLVCWDRATPSGTWVDCTQKENLSNWYKLLVIDEIFNTVILWIQYLQLVGSCRQYFFEVKDI